jgi:hemolysin-activating ACP:hemolysin acyltransferase
LSEKAPNPPGRIRLEVGALTERNLVAVLSTVSRYPPFAAYSFGLMVYNLTNQLRYGASVLAIDQGRLVGYAGWLRVDAEQARLWQTGARGIPDEDWQHGRAVIVTVTVAENPALLAPILHAISDVCAGLPVYRMRSFQDGRPDIRRPPITGRKWQFQTSPG